MQPPPISNEALQALRESEVRYRALFDNMAEGFALFGVVRGSSGQVVDLIYREANKALERQTGFDRAKTIGQPLTAILTPSDAARFIPFLARAADPGEPVTVEEYAEVVDRWFEVSAYPHGQDEIVAFYRDISERKRAEAVLRESEERQAFLLKLSDALRAEPSAEAIADRAVRMLFEKMRLDRCFLGIFFLEEDRAEYHHQVHDDRLPPLPAEVRISDFPEALQVLLDGSLVIDNIAEKEGFSDDERANIEALGLHALIDVTLRKGEKNPLWAIIAGSIHPRVWTPGEVALVEEVAERTWAAVERARAEAARTESDAKYRTLFEKMDEGFSLLERVVGEPVDYRFLAANPAYERHTGLSNPVGRTIREITPSVEDAVLECYRNVEETGLSQTVVTHVSELDIWFEVEASSTEQPGQIAVLFKDVTERKHAEAVLRESEKRQAFLLKLSDALRAEQSAEAKANRALRMLYEQMALDRCYVGIYRLAEDIGEFPHQVHDDSLPPVPAQIRLSDFPEALRMAFDRTMVIDDATTMKSLSDSDRASFGGLGLRAAIAATLRKGESNPLWAIVAGSTCPRAWTPGEISLVEEVAERTWAAIERFSAEAALHAAHDTFRQLVDFSPFGIYAINADFRLAQISNGAQKVFENVHPAIGRDLAEVLRVLWPEPFASEAIARFRHTLVTGEGYTEEVTEQRADIAASEAYDWKLERITMPDGRFGVVCHFYDLSERKRHEDHAQLLMAEVNHRAKNLLSVVQAVAQQTANSGDPLTFATRLSDRIGGLSANQDLLVKNLWHGVAVNELVTSQLAHFKDLIGTRVHLLGPELTVTAAVSQAIGMAVHELATNAAKYGALSNSNGQVHVEWQLTAGPNSEFLMSWRESDGPPVKPPTRNGFGQTVIKRLVETSVEGNVKVNYAEDGFSWHLETGAVNVLVISGGGIKPE